jgi:hypothetical protein
MLTVATALVFRLSDQILGKGFAAIANFGQAWSVEIAI